MSSDFLFVCGFPSSGTDLLRNILNAHRQINIGGEFPLLPTLASDYLSIVAPDDISLAQDAIRNIDVYKNLKNHNVDLSNSESVEFAELFSRMLTADRVDWTGTKTPQNTENIDKLLQLFPKARFVIVVRDVRDVAMSWRNKWGKNTLLCAQKWDSRMAKSIRSTAKLRDSQYLYVLYEDLLKQLEAEARRICEFLEISFDPRMLKFQEYVEEKVPGKINFGQAIVRGNSGKWIEGLAPIELKKIEGIAWHMMNEFGYVPELVSGPRPITKTEIIRGHLQDIVATLAVGNRSLKEGRLAYRLTLLRVLSRKLIAQAFGRIS